MQTSGVISRAIFSIYVGNNHDASFAAWCLFNTVYSVYASSWVRNPLCYSCYRCSFAYILLRTFSWTGPFYGPTQNTLCFVQS